ncbi:hypothetical protein GCM10010140_28730 [Streptosporangium pseudovulgare]|uniref:Uncharacterized protein n=1 Tax=Streptosporangium pseudovulgare TaxID=35765 RepID=A0ABQ2QUF6_9ACTN|nr:hypothetical protein GCM10010140_28730 [Streptosporangium pseudovulgare]
MLSASVTTKIRLGTGRENPWDRSRATAHAVSISPDNTSTTHAIVIWQSLSQRFCPRAPALRGMMLQRSETVFIIMIGSLT